MIETFVTAINNDINDSEPKAIPRDNLTKEERRALKDLQNREDIIITKADKGGAVVIWDTKDYIAEAERQLNDITTYEKLESDPTDRHIEIIKITLQNFKTQGIIEPRIADRLIPEKVRTPRFYMLPKIHKPNNPGRPVISSVSSHTSEISRFVDHHIQENVKKLNSYVKDTTDFINKIESQPPVPTQSFLVSMDVKSLYTNIPHQEGIEAVKASLDETPSSAPTAVILTFIKLILTLNNFIFNDHHYLQTKGCAMGTKCAPCYANLFMGKFETTYIYPKIKDFSRLYLRYIDDIFMIWNGTKHELHCFVEELNISHATIKFDVEVHTNEINFLDTTVYKDFDGKLRTRIYRKPTDRQNFLHYKSEHPPALKKSIPYSQALRIRKICNKDIDFEDDCIKLAGTFQSRGYNKTFIEEQIRKAAETPRSDLLKEKIKEPATRIPFITTYNRTLPSLNGIISKHWNILQIDRDIKDIFVNKPIIAYRRNINLKDLIGSNIIQNNTKVNRKSIVSKRNIIGKCHPCFSKEGNLCCKQIKTTTSFKSDKTNRCFDIFHIVDCKSTMVIYLMECELCPGKQYVGKCETSLNMRINTHRSDVWRNNGPFCDKHFRLDGHNFNVHARFTIIEKIEKPPNNKMELRALLEHKEDLWMKRLQTIKPDGLNTGFNYPQTLTGCIK